MHQRRDRRWTIILVPDGSSRSHSFALSASLAKVLLGIGWAFGIAIIALGVAAVARGLNVTRNMRLEQEHQVLVTEIAGVQAHLTALADTIVAVGQRDQELRLMANLPLLD